MLVCRGAEAVFIKDRSDRLKICRPLRPQIDRAEVNMRSGAPRLRLRSLRVRWSTSVLRRPPERTASAACRIIMIARSRMSKIGFRPAPANVGSRRTVPDPSKGIHERGRKTG